ncbi:outer membrane lipoprotein carrier protein LolA [Methylomonas sp. HW2-6]|uniref:outer membrane lipoprotein carrier protein LolA n=1 Tax=Methylomonas sp. HW2-6 TaxID=3376687 RepID=UPI0040438BD3
MKTLSALLLWLSATAAQADDALAAIKSRLVPAAIVQGHFRQEKQLKFLSKPLVSEGEFTFQQQRGVIWKTVSPVESVLLIGENRLITSQGEQALPASFGRVFPAMLGGDFAELSADFSASAEMQADSWRLTLLPKDPLLGKAIAAIYLAGDSELRSVEIRETGGNVSRIGFDRISRPAQLSPEQAAEFARLSP